METTSYPAMEYSLSDIQLPDPPKEKDKISVTLNKSSKGVNSSSKSEKNHAPKSETQSNPTSNSVKEMSDSNVKKVCDPPSPPPCVVSEDTKKDHIESEKNTSEELKNPSKEVNKHKSKEPSPTVDRSSEVKEVNSKNSVTQEVAMSEENCDSSNDTKQSEAKVDSKKNSHSSSSSNSKMKEQRSKSKKRGEPAVSPSKEKDSQDAPNANREDSAADKESGKIVRKRKNRRTSRSSSQSSSSESSSSNGSSPECESSHSKKSGKSGSSSEGIASPSSSGSSSESESEEGKKSPPKEKLKAVKTSCAENSEGGVKPRRKINRNLSLKGFQENAVTKDTESEDAQEPSTTSQKLKKDDTTEKNDETSKKTEVREIKFTPRKLSLTSLKSSEKLENQDSEKTNSKIGGKKRKWGNCTAALPKASVSISSDSLKTLIPDLKPFTVAPVLSDQDDLSNPVDMESPKKEPKIVNLPVHEEMVVEEVSTHSQADKPSNITDAKDLPNESVQVSPAHNPTSNIIFIKNLVRPFTLLQLKDLLKQSGNMIEERFWIDKIKSKCIVVYETEEQAVATRNALHGTRWPLSNPKILSVDFSSEEELDAHRNMTEYPKPAKVAQRASLEKQEMKEAHTVDIPKRKNREEHRRDKDRQKVPITHVREWDKDKLTQDSPDQASHRVEKDAEKSRSDKRKEKKDSKRRVDDDAPAKLLDDLFRKTRASPCIYWLPLTEEQAKQREEERQARRMEREKRWQQRKEQEESERRNRTKGHSGREKESRRSQSRSRSPQGRRR